MVLLAITFTTRFILFVILIRSVLCDQPNETAIKPNNANLIQKARELVYNFLNKTENKLVPGLVVSVSVKGEQKWLEGFGLANIENNVSMSGDAVMQIGSISKSFAVGLASRLMQEEKLDFNFPIRKYLSKKDFPDKKWNGKVVNITLQQLLQMTAGIPNGLGDHNLGQCFRCKNQTERLIYMRDKELEFKPGTRYTYSNYGFELAGAVIESVLKNKTFDDAITELIENILKLNKTSIVNTHVITPHIASFYSNANGSLANSGLLGDILLNDFHASGGIIATMTDLLTYGQIWLDAYLGRSQHFLKQLSVKNAWTPTAISTATSSAYGYGMGWAIQNTAADRPSGKQVVWHDGGTYGCRSMLAIYPDTEIMVAVAVNLEECAVETFVLDGEIADLFATLNVTHT